MPLPAAFDPEDERYTWSLLDRLRAGDREAGELLFAAHAERLRRAMRAELPALRGVVDEEDVVQRAIARALGRLDRFEWRGKGAFLAWLVRIAVNVAHDELEREARRTPKLSAGSTVGDDSRLETATSVVDVGSRGPRTPLDRLLRDEEKLLVEQALDDLSENDRRLIVARKILGQDYETLAADMEITTGAVRTRVSRVLNQLARSIERRI